QHHPREVLSGLVVVPVLAGLGALLTRQRRQDRTTHGSARWATPAEVRQSGLAARHGVVIGRLGGHLLRDDSETHVLLCGPTRSGKGTGIIIPTLLTWRESALILDPKDGENLAVTAQWRTCHGQVAAFTPCRTPQARINVLDTIRLKTRQ